MEGGSGGSNCGESVEEGREELAIVEGVVVSRMQSMGCHAESVSCGRKVWIVGGEFGTVAKDEFVEERREELAKVEAVAWIVRGEVMKQSGTKAMEGGEWGKLREEEGR